MTPTTTVRQCAGTRGFTTTGYGFQPVRCERSVALVRVGNEWACPDHREQVRRLVARKTASDARCHCGSRLTARGCSNSDCGLWEGPR